MTGPAEFTAELIPNRDQFAACEAEWSSLFERAANRRPWHRHGWLSLAWRRGARAVLVRAGGRPVMAGAFLMHLRRLQPAISFLRAPIPQTDDVLHVDSPEAPRHAALLLSTLARDLVLPRQMRIGRLPASSPLRIAIAAYSDGPWWEGHPRDSFHVALPSWPSFDDYLFSRGSNLRHDHARRQRRLAELGPVKLQREPGRDAGATLAWLLDNKRQWLRRTGHTADWLSSRSVDHFLARLQASPAAAQWSVWSLRLDAQPIAVLLVFEEGEVWIPHIIAQDISFNAYSPGRTINLMLIEHAFTAGAKRVELGISGGSWKRPLAAETETLFAEKFRLK